jgi:hypothetical protein
VVSSACERVLNKYQTVRAEGENRDYFGVNSACEGVLNKIQTVRVEEDALHYSRSTPNPTKFTRSCDNNHFLTTTAAIKLF